ncbi:hypothetical protein Tco_1212803 [Tanacetum coccineum]
MFVFFVNTPLQNTMAEQNVPNQPPTRTMSRLKALAITPVNLTHPFELPPSGDTVIDFVNELGYPEPVEIVSNIRRASMGRSLPHGIQTFFSTQSKTQSQSEEPKEESNSSPPIPYGKYRKWLHHNTKKTLKKVPACNPTAKRAITKKPTTTTPVKQSKPAPAPTKKPSKHKLPQKIRKGKPSFQLVDEEKKLNKESVPQEEGG